MVAAVHILVWSLALYLAAGLVFAALFVIFGVQRIDPQAHGAGTGFRLMIVPGVAALWPFLLARWVTGRSTP